MTRLVAMAHEEEKQNNWQHKLMHDNIRQNQLCIPTTNKAIPKPPQRELGYGLVKDYRPFGISRNSSLFV